VLQTFPDDIAPEVTAGPMFFTDVVVLQSGRESRNANWQQARWKGEVRIPARQIAQGQQLLHFFRAVGGGMANPFRVRDWSDYTTTGSEGVFAVIDATHFQAYKRYTSGSATHNRKITRLRGTPAVTGGSGLSWDLDTGILTSSGMPSAWVGQFDVPVRFDTDQMQFHIVSQNRDGLIVEWDSVQLIEVRE
jgi:uncharacterized protein (TIGR02217 family)